MDIKTSDGRIITHTPMHEVHNELAIPDKKLISLVASVLARPERRRILSGRELSFLDSLVRSWNACKDKTLALPFHTKRMAYNSLDVHGWLD